MQARRAPRIVRYCLNFCTLDFDFFIASLGESVGVRDDKRVQNTGYPVAHCCGGPDSRRVVSVLLRLQLGFVQIHQIVRSFEYFCH